MRHIQSQRIAYFQFTDPLERLSLIENFWEHDIAHRFAVLITSQTALRRQCRFFRKSAYLMYSFAPTPQGSPPLHLTVMLKMTVAQAVLIIIFAHESKFFSLAPCSYAIFTIKYQGHANCSLISGEACLLSFCIVSPAGTLKESASRTLKNLPRKSRQRAGKKNEERHQIAS